MNRRQAAAGRQLITATLAFINPSVYVDVLPQGERVPSHPPLTPHWPRAASSGHQHSDVDLINVHSTQHHFTEGNVVGRVIIIKLEES